MAITEAKGFDNIRKNLSGAYELGNDIDLKSITNYVPIGGLVGNEFKGALDGKGYKITGLSVKGGDFSGLFGCCTGAKISNLIVEGDVRGGSTVGGIVGLLSGGLIENCKFNGSVEGTGYQVGGIAGYISAGGRVDSCGVTGGIKAGEEGAGGIAGLIDASGGITGCWHIGKVNGGNSGGICGAVENIAGGQGAAPVITNCYHIGDISGKFSLGGIVGRTKIAAKVENCYCLGNIINTSTTGICGGIAGESTGISVTGSISMCSSIETLGKVQNVHPIAFGRQSSGNVISDCFAWTGMLIKSDTGIKEAADYPDVAAVGLTSSPGTFFRHTLKFDFSSAWVTYEDEYPFPKLRPKQTAPAVGLSQPSSHVIEPRFFNMGGEIGNCVYIPEQLDFVRKCLDKDFVLKNAIDLTGYISPYEPNGRFMPIGSPSQPFCGGFNGGGMEIKSDIDCGGIDSVGLFACVGETGVIKNLKVSGRVRGRSGVGLIAGSNMGEIRGCAGAGIAEGAENIGILVGSNFNKINNCFSSRSSGAEGGYKVGGIAGENSGGIEYCYARGFVRGAESIGGIAGINFNLEKSGMVKFCAAINASYTIVSRGCFYHGLSIGENRGEYDKLYYCKGIGPGGAGGGYDGEQKELSGLTVLDFWKSLGFKLSNRPLTAGDSYWFWVGSFPVLMYT